MHIVHVRSRRGNFYKYVFVNQHCYPRIEMPLKIFGILFEHVFFLKPKLRAIFYHIGCPGSKKECSKLWYQGSFALFRYFWDKGGLMEMPFKVQFMRLFTLFICFKKQSRFWPPVLLTLQSSSSSSEIWYSYNVNFRILQLWGDQFSTKDNFFYFRICILAWPSWQPRSPASCEDFVNVKQKLVNFWLIRCERLLLMWCEEVGGWRCEDVEREQEAGHSGLQEGLPQWQDHGLPRKKRLCRSRHTCRSHWW